MKQGGTGRQVAQADGHGKEMVCCTHILRV